MTVRSLAALAAVTLAVGACSAPHEPGAGLEPGVHAIECAPGLAREDAITLLSADHYGVGGWSHVNGIGSFESVRQPVSAYRITAENYVADDTCGQAKTWSVVLAKKTGDWDRNHANGMEAAMPQRDILFSHVQDITMVVKVSSEGTYLPSAEELIEAYGPWLSREQVEQIDDGTVVVEAILFGDSTEPPYVNASTLITVPADLMDQWVRVHVPREQWTFYAEENYVRTEISAEDYPDHRVAGLRLNPETSSTQVARHLIGDSFDAAAVPEVFKEVAWTFALIEVGRVSDE